MPDIELPPFPINPAAILSSLVLGAFLLAIAIWDARTMRIPDFFSLPLIVLGLGAAIVVSRLPLYEHLIGAAAGYAVLAALAFLYQRARGQEGLGLGDAKLLAAGGAWLGWAALPSVLLAGSFTGLGHALVRAALGGAAARDRRIPFGPHLAFAIFLIWLIGPFGAPAIWR
jgi:leader peptidase (prepilin peptidase)/N-methyltransferase